jgi:hypothetical protein
MDAEDFALDAQDEPPEPLTMGGWPIIAQLVGGVGVFLGLIVTLIFSTVGDINHLAGGHLSPLRGVLGLLGALLGGVGVALLSRRRGLAAILLVLAAALWFVAFHLYGFIASPFLLFGALLSFAGRAPADSAVAVAEPPDA